MNISWVASQKAIDHWTRVRNQIAAVRAKRALIREKIAEAKIEKNNEIWMISHKHDKIIEELEKQLLET